MNELTRCKIMAVDGQEYRYNVQVHKSYDGGKTWWYAGHGRFCRTLAEAHRYARKMQSTVATWEMAALAMAFVGMITVV